MMLELTVVLGCCCGTVVVVGLKEGWEEDNEGCRCVWLKEERSRCGAGLLYQWSLLLRKPKGKQTLLMEKEMLLLEVWVLVEAGLR